MPQATDQYSTGRCDQLIAISEAIKVMNERYRTLERLPKAIGIEATYRNREMADLNDRMCILRDYMTVIQAKSLGGALVQLGELHNIIEMGSGSEDSTEQRIRRLMYSIIGALESVIPTDILERIEDRGANINPWVPYDERLKSLQREAA